MVELPDRPARFALASAGVVLDRTALERAATGTIAWGVVIGLTVGKPVGIVLASAIGIRARAARLPDGVRPAHLLGAGMLAGIGFTVSLFIAELSFNGSELDEAKVGILVASIVSGTLGSIVLLVQGGRERSARRANGPRSRDRVVNSAASA